MGGASQSNGQSPPSFWLPSPLAWIQKNLKLQMSYALKLVYACCEHQQGNKCSSISLLIAVLQKLTLTWTKSALMYLKLCFYNLLRSYEESALKSLLAT